MINDGEIIKGRGAQHPSENKFFRQQYVREFEEGLDVEADLDQPTELIEVFPKSIVNQVKSPDIPFSYSLNPYQGCEHGCTYCYARNSHMYWGYEPALEFESKILYKKNAAELLKVHFNKKSWKAETIVLSGNTDCYQPIERKLELTRSLLKVFLQYKNPVGIVTKNSLIRRDLDILKELAKDNLIHVFISLTTLDEKLRRVMEPRTASSAMRLKTIEKLSNAGIAVGIMAAPIIPGLNSHEIPMIAKSAASAGARVMKHTVVRLNGSIGAIFMDWLNKHFPDRSKKVMHQIEELHGGKLNDSNFGRRMKGDGKMAEMIKQMIRQNERRYFGENSLPPYNTSLFHRAGENYTIPGL